MQRDQAHRTNELLERIAKALEKKQPNILYNGDLKNIEDIPGFEGTLDKLDDLCNVRKDNTLSDKCLAANCDGDECTHNDDIHNDYLNDLVQEMNKEQYIKFCQEMSYVNYDLKVVQHSIDELEYEECLGAIKQAQCIIGEPDEQAPLAKGKDPYNYSEINGTLREFHCGVVNDSDFNIRKKQ